MTIALVGLLVPSIAVTVRRMHDLNVSGWWADFIPCIKLNSAD
ncbi:DUF805 domain-containing protein [Succinivibrio dextrinosolvens]